MMRRGGRVQFVSVNQLIDQATEVAARLDALGSRDYREITLLALQRAEEDYAAIVTSRQSLPASPEETAVLDELLDNLRARLTFYTKRR
jgi:hypothetical protein